MSEVITVHLFVSPRVEVILPVDSCRASWIVPNPAPTHYVDESPDGRIGAVRQGFEAVVPTLCNVGTSG